MGRKDILDQIPSAKELRRRFGFIKNETLRGNIANTLRHVTFLLVLQEEDKINGPVKSSLFKDSVLHCASVVEGLLHYAIQRYLQKNSDQGILEEKLVEVKSWGELVIPGIVGGRQQKVFGVVKEMPYSRFYGQDRFCGCAANCTTGKNTWKEPISKM